MSKLETYQREIRRMDELSRQDTPVHYLHPLAKLITTMVFLLVVLSCPAPEVFDMLPFFVYPLFVAVAGNIPGDFLLWRVLLAAPFVLCLVLSSLFFAPPGTAGGWLPALLPLAGMILKFILAVLAGALLLATTGLVGLSRAFSHLPVPRLFVQQTLFLYRYIHVLLLEVGQVLRAHSLRGGGRGLGRKEWGPLLGQLLIRTLERCDNIHQAMLCRGFTGRLPELGSKRAGWLDAAYTVVFCSLFLYIRFYTMRGA